MDKIKVLIVDDHSMFRAGIKALLDTQEDIQAIGEASDGKEALSKAKELKPEVVLMDIAMPGLGGLKSTSLLKEELPEVEILTLTMHDTEEYFFEMLKAGASGYILKESPPSELFNAIREVARGNVYISPAMARKFVNDYLKRAKTGEESKSYGVLTEREREVLRLIAEGMTNQEIATQLVISTSTVQTYRTRLMSKLNLENRSQLIKYALRHGLIDMDM